MTANAEAHLGFDPDKIEMEIRRLGEDLAGHHAAASLLENMRKSIRAKLWFVAPNDLKAVEARNNWADAHDEYVTFIKSMIAAREEADRARARYESFKIYVDLKRTAAATERAMMQIR